jgi:uncharacterized coiled-coil protein SlyX
MADEEGNEHQDDPVVEHVEETLDTSKTLTLDHLNEMKKQLDNRLDTLSKDKSKDEQEKAELKGKIESLEDHLKILTERLEDKEKSGGGETMLIAPEELNPKQQNDGVEEDHTGDGPPPREPRKGWKRWV